MRLAPTRKMVRLSTWTAVKRQAWHNSNAWSVFSQDGLPDPFRQKCPLAPSRQRCPLLPLRQKYLRGPFHQRGLSEPWPKAGPPARKKRLPEQVHRKRLLQPSRQRRQLVLRRPAHLRGALISLQSHRIQIESEVKQRHPWIIARSSRRSYP